MERQESQTAKNSSDIEGNVEYAKSMARKFFRQRYQLGVDYADFEGAALLGLCSAARRYDPSRGIEFKAFCSVRIRGAMYDHLRETGPLRRAQLTKECVDRRVDASTDTSERIRIFAQDIELYYGNLGLRYHAEPSGDETHVVYADLRTPEVRVHRKSVHHELLRALRSLPERYRRLIELRYFQEMSLEDIGKELGGLKRSWISRMHDRALALLKEQLTQCERGNDTLSAEDLYVDC